MTQDQFIDAMAVQNPRWFLEFATAGELLQYVQDAQPGFNGKPSHFSIAQLNKRLKQNVSNRLYMPLRAAVHAGFMAETTPLTKL